MNDAPSASYQPAFDELLHQIKQARQAVFTQVNAALIDLYWSLGKAISLQVQSQAWGKGVVAELARYITLNAPEIKGFGDKNLWRMKQFYETYQGDEATLPLLRTLPWTHNTIIFSRCKSVEEREYYLRLASSERWGKRALERQIDFLQYQRSLIGAKLSALLRELQPTADQVFRDIYVLEFLGLPDDHIESDLQKALIQNMKMQYL